MPQGLQKALLQTVIEQMPAAVIVAEAPSGRILAANEQVARVWRKPVLEAIDGLGDEWPLLRSLRNGEVVEREEMRIVRGDGTQGYILVSAAPIHQDGHIAAAVVTFFDVTDQRREQEALALLADVGAAAGESLRHEQTLRTIARMTIPKFADMTFVHRIEGGVLQRSEVATSDPDLEARVRETWKRFPSPSVPLLKIAESGRAAHRAEIRPEDYERLGGDDAYRAAIASLGIRSVIAVPMMTGGRPIGLITFIMTTSGRRFDSFDVLIAEEIARRAAVAIERSALFEAEREHRIRAERSTRRMEHLQELTAALLPAVTLEAVCDVVMDAPARLVGARAAALALVRGDELVVLKTQGINPEIVSRYRAMPLDAPWPITRAAASGQPIWLHNRDEAIEFSPIIRDVSSGQAWANLPLTMHGRTIGALGFVFDQPQTFPEEERTYLTSLAGQCAIAIERAELFESERRAREEAEAASRAKDDFLAVLSHELRTPMTTVIGWADFLKMTHGNDPALAQPLEALRNSARTQAKLVDDLLDVSRIIAGKLAIRKIDTELRGVVKTAAESMRLSAEERRVHLDVATGDTPVPIHGDPDRLQQIVTNLLVNAIKFTPAGGRVRVTLASRDGEADVIVEDTGEGISPEFLPLVFDRFRQASSGDTRRHTGLGLGLSIVQHLAQLHGGSVRAESEGLGKGARFTVTLQR